MRCLCIYAPPCKLIGHTSSTCLCCTGTAPRDDGGLQLSSEGYAASAHMPSLQAGVPYFFCIPTTHLYKSLGWLQAGAELSRVLPPSIKSRLQGCLPYLRSTGEACSSCLSLAERLLCQCSNHISGQGSSAVASSSSSMRASVPYLFCLPLDTLCKRLQDGGGLKLGAPNFFMCALHLL